MVVWAAGMLSLGLAPAPRMPLRAAARGGRGVAPRSAVREVVVVGGGWAGYAAADALSASGDCHVTLLEASPRAAGGLAAGWRTPGGRPVEAGIHGFWRYYTNTLALLDSLGVDAEEVRVRVRVSSHRGLGLRLGLGLGFPPLGLGFTA